MSTEFNFPADPVVGDIFVLPNGSETQWNGTEWALVIQEVVYPITIDKGGTGAIDVATALLNLEIPFHNTIEVVGSTGQVILKGTDDIIGYGLLIKPTVAGNAGIGLQKSRETDSNIITGYSGKVLESIRWHIIPGDATPESGTNAGANFSINSHDDIGDYMGTPFGITRSSGDAAFRTSNGIRITATGHAAITLDKPTGFTAGINGMTNGLIRWGLRIPDNDPETGSNLGSSFAIWRYDDAGNPIDKPISIARDTGTVYSTGMYESTINNGSDGFYCSANAGFRSNKTTNDAFYAPYGGVSIGLPVITSASVGMTVNGFSSDGTTYALQQMLLGSPNWSTIDIRTRYQYSGWAGVEMFGNGCTIDFLLSAGSGFGSIWAAAFTVQSDAETKEAIIPISSALNVLDGIQAYTYLLKEEVTRNVDVTIFGVDIRQAGTLAQDWQTRFPEAVKTHNGSLGLDYAAISAINSQAISELLQRVKSLEAQLAALDL
jgi:Chaperone of endosialidase